MLLTSLSLNQLHVFPFLVSACFNQPLHMCCMNALICSCMPCQVNPCLALEPLSICCRVILILVMPKTHAHSIAYVQSMHQVARTLSQLHSTSYMCHASFMALRPLYNTSPKLLCTWVCANPSGTLHSSVERLNVPRVCMCHAIAHTLGLPQVRPPHQPPVCSLSPHPPIFKQHLSHLQYVRRGY